MKYTKSALALLTACAAFSAYAGMDLCIPGRPVAIQYAGQWYPGKVLKGPDRMGTCLVSYDGYGANWDEWVKPSRLRSAAAAPAPSAPAAAPSNGLVPPGRYNCYTYDSGQLNYSYTDVVIQGARYSVGRDSGSYTLGADGAMRFTGTMSNAAGKFSVKRSGKPQIDLVFNGDNRASMACSKER